MAYYDNSNRGALFKNDRKERDTQPDYTGSLNVDGVEFFLDAWLKTSGKGVKFMSVSVKKKDRQPGGEDKPQRGTGSDRQAPGPSRDLDDEIPF